METNSHGEIALGAKDSADGWGANTFSPELADSTSLVTGQGSPTCLPPRASIKSTSRVRSVTPEIEESSKIH